MRLADDDVSRGNDPIALDALFILGRGIAVNLGDGSGTLRAVTESGLVGQGWVWTDSDTVLADFLVWLASVERRFIRARSPIVNYLAPFMLGRQLFFPRGLPPQSGSPEQSVTLAQPPAPG